MFIQVFERICMEVLWEAHVRAFEFIGGVPWRITYDNERIMAAKILSGHERKVTDGFLKLQSHYLFREHFCNVESPNEKGVVESMVKYGRLNFLVPVPQVRGLVQLNEELLERCIGDLKHRQRGKEGDKASRLEEDRLACLPLPAGRFDASTKRSTTASSLSLVRFDDNDYSVPVRYAHHPVVVKGYTDRVEISYLDERIARHDRLWQREGVSFDPVHYLALLEHKPGALDHARPLENWQLPGCFGVLRRRLEDEREGEGTREYIRVMRLLEKYDLKTLERAVEKGLRCGALSRDAIQLFLMPQPDWTQATFDLEGREHLKGVRVAAADVSMYAGLLQEGGRQ